MMGLDETAWFAWLAYRKAIKKPLKEASWPLAQKRLASFGTRQMEAVENSIANGWTVVFPPPKEKAEVDRERRNNLERVLLAELRARAEKIGFRDYIEGKDFLGGYQALVERAEHQHKMSRPVTRGPQPVGNLLLPRNT